MSFTLETIPAPNITSSILFQCATLFSSAYGIWGSHAAQKVAKHCKHGNRIRLSVERLRAQSLVPAADSVLVRAMHGDELAGYTFATRWMYEGRRICWVTQLCVGSQWRRRGLATELLRRLREDGDYAFGILSSHPAAIMAGLRAWGRGIENVDVDLVKEHGAGIMAASPVQYVRDAKLRGSFFGSGDDDSAVCCADTDFWVDHAEPLATLAEVKRRFTWPFGQLPEGCEFLALIQGV
ncbi:hypothetical protein COCMIDRAFT_106489 [Bipolaris oryzae ATCC 44560]|uniref:N-acetyltransferase domain-containing protein n=1 Tax=Bipolaris oryzae ATCC 44560 TaxID=930090 RepID=W6YUT0_COCMI|nr:uncharacterized protein COCMIDRAFT_106489 [Bipolaris oryzae ATCC 44560]EUC41318.1 hypothetical protein COCMIDRAFT_106489 [Bipolaris oryzae ATCC 44560]